MPAALLAQAERPYQLLADITKKKDLNQLHTVRQHLQLDNFKQAIENLAFFRLPLRLKGTKLLLIMRGIAPAGIAEM